MNTSEFLNLLKTHSEAPLQFAYLEGQLVRSDYHITEIKNVSFDTVDCGGVRNQWQEVHVQLWENETPEPHHQVTTTKALEIFSAVNQVRETLGDVEIKFEYGNEQLIKTVLPIREAAFSEGQLVVHLGFESTCCKAKERATTDEERAAACCAPAPASVASKGALPVNQDCAPDSGCC